MYKQIIDIYTKTASTKEIMRMSDNAVIPFDTSNMDFVEYNKWLSEGNIPLPPDEPTLP
jgi:hypothetical protein